MVNEMSVIENQIRSFFTGYPIIQNFLLSLSQIQLLLLSILSVFIVFSLKALFLLGVGFFVARFIYEPNED